MEALPIRSWSGRSVIRWVRRAGDHRGRHRGDGQSPQCGWHDVGEQHRPCAVLLPLRQVGRLKETWPLMVSWPGIQPLGTGAAPGGLWLVPTCIGVGTPFWWVGACAASVVKYCKYLYSFFVVWKILLTYYFVYYNMTYEILCNCISQHPDI